MEKEKFQQKALKQTKQKKSKSAEFLMVKEDREAMEGIGNPAFNMSSLDLSAYQTSEKKVITHDVLDHTLVDHQQKFRLPDPDETQGNEYRRNYFDPLMDEEINPRQCRMEVSREAPLQVDNRSLYNDRLIRLFDKNGCRGAQGESTEKEPSSSEETMCSSKNLELHKEDGEATSACNEQFKRYAQKDIIQLASSSLKQDFKFEGEELNQYIPMSCLKTDKIFEKAPSQLLTADRNVCQEDRTAKLGAVMEGTHESKGAAGPCWQVEQSQSPQPLQIQMKCVRGLKNKVPQGSYLIKVSLLSQPGGCVLQWWQTAQLKIRTCPVRHDGNFYDVGLYFHENLHVSIAMARFSLVAILIYLGPLYFVKQIEVKFILCESTGFLFTSLQVLPPKKDVKPDMAFLFELVLLRGKYACCDCVVGWSAFPLCDNNFDVVEGKFKCPLLQGHYDQKLNNFRKIEDLICLDLNHWLCNLYFQVIKLPVCLNDQNTHVRHIQLPPEFPVCLKAEAGTTESDVENTTGLSGKEKEKNICASVNNKAKSSLHSPQGSIFNKIDSCPMDRDLNLLKEDQELHNKGESLTDHSVKEKTTAWRSGEIKDYSQDISYLEELEKHRFSVCCSSVAGSGEFLKHLHFTLVSVFSELQLAQWRSQGFWYIILLMASLWFLRLYLHYLSQWLFLQAISTPVTKFHFSALTVELCYPPSSLHITEELLVVVAGPLMLNAMILPLVLIRRGCHLLFAYCPDVLSKLIITMGLWTVLDPLAVFIVDAVLGRLIRNGEETPMADAAKLYWAFIRTTQSGILGALLTVLVYIILFIISSLILYLYCLRLHNDSRILDVFQRIHSEETKFFMPYDLEISNQDLSYIVKKSQQWRGVNGERRKVAVYDYIWKNHSVKSGISSCDLQHLNEICVPAHGPGDITSHLSIYTVYPSGFQELYRHFLRLPGGTIIEVFGVISDLKFIPSEVVTAIQEHINEMDSTMEYSFDAPSRNTKRTH